MLKPNKRIAYQSDLSDEGWELIKLHIPIPITNRGKKRVHLYREILNAIFYLLRSGCAWRLLPHDFPPWKTVYHYFRLWRLDGTWKRINDILRADLRVLSSYRRLNIVQITIPLAVAFSKRALST